MEYLPEVIEYFISQESARNGVISQTMQYFQYPPFQFWAKIRHVISGTSSPLKPKGDLSNHSFGKRITSHSPPQRLAQAGIMFSTVKSTIHCSKSSPPPTQQPEGTLKPRPCLVSWLSHANARQQAQVRKQGSKAAWLLPIPCWEVLQCFIHSFCSFKVDLCLYRHTEGSCL